MLFKKGILAIAVVLALFSCKTLAQKRENWSFENYLLEAQSYTSKRRYSSAIKVLNDIMLKFPNEKLVMVNYLIGYNYYELNNYNNSKLYLTKVYDYYNVLTTENELYENEKFVALSKILLDRIERLLSNFDPYHIKEELEKKENDKVIKPKT